MALLPTTPPSLSPFEVDEAPETPGPIRARVNNLQSQVFELVRKEHAATRRNRAEKSVLENTVTTQKAQLVDTQASLATAVRDLDRSKIQGKAWQAELARCKSEGDGMRDELNLYSLVQQHKALLALAEEQLQIVALEQRLLQAETAKTVMRDHKIALFKTKEDDFAAELAEKDARLQELDARVFPSQANTSLAHQRAAESKTNKLLISNQDKQHSKAQSDLEEARAEIARLEGRVDGLETKVRGLKEREKEARAELDGWLREEKGKEGSVDKEKRELQSGLRAARIELQKKNEDLNDVQEELATVRESSKEREKVLKAKYREATEERDRLASIEEELETLKTSASSAQARTKKTQATLPAQSETGVPGLDRPRKNASVSPEALLRAVVRKSIKDKSRKANSVVEEDVTYEEVLPQRKIRKAENPAPARQPKALVEGSESESAPIKLTIKRNSPKQKLKAPVLEVAADNIERRSVGQGVKVDGEGDAQPEKKKKRKLFGAQPSFTWDPIMNSADGVIPAYLSPVKAVGTGTTGAIPRIGFPSLASSRSFGRF
ncbi:MAG: hypothetical protein TREMPRED_003614 [Tremellales sp. Tagirdzhanova-0007]|nr:MAG: hypothetical protein TREMPRED_003614 [Tremellales sp. Tagirdzhanova-0007]